jgi:hypothetical protein
MPSSAAVATPCRRANGLCTPGEPPALRLALAALAGYTATPADAYAAIWEGWIAGDPAPEAPRVPIPNRMMLLFTGPVGLLRDAPELARFGPQLTAFMRHIAASLR